LRCLQLAQSVTQFQFRGTVSVFQFCHLTRGTYLCTVVT
jgi:hypothetical protein